ncbi:hypothetical protein [Enterococcus sp. AZ109]|uniref:hypothetical protein n=1 Tax=Enterococcus sp. AZ109 TaxID=2774634 RepID=UPI003F1FFE46
MDKNYLQKLPFFYFLLPYIHLSLMIDYYLHSLMGIIGSILITALLGFYARRTYQVPLLIMSNGINIILSYLLTRIQGSLLLPYLGYSSYLALPLLVLLFLSAQIVGLFWGGFFIER